MDQVIEKLDELIAAVKANSIPIAHRWLDADAAGAMLGYKPRQFRERIACRPDFPKPMRLDGTGHPRWLASELIEWARKQR